MFLLILSNFFKQVTSFKYFRVALEIVLVLAAVYGGILIHRHYNPAPQIVQTTPNVQTIYLPGATVTGPTVTKYLKDPKDAATAQQLLAENSKLKTTVTELTNTVATLQTSGGTKEGGVITPAPEPIGDSAAPGNVAPSTNIGPWTFADWQLKATYSPSAFEYTLNQKFVIQSTQGRDTRGKPIALVNVFQVGQNDSRIPVPAQTTVLTVDQTKDHWMVHPNVQGGIVFGQNARGGIVGLQWLHKGRTTAPSDQTWAALTPVVSVTAKTKELGLLPVSVNLGRLPHQPFTNVWASPYVGFGFAKGVSISQFGFAISATF